MIEGGVLGGLLRRKFREWNLVEDGGEEERSDDELELRHCGEDQSNEVIDNVLLLHSLLRSEFIDVRALLYSRCFAPSSWTTRSLLAPSYRESK